MENQDDVNDGARPVSCTTLKHETDRRVRNGHLHSLKIIFNRVLSA